MAVSLSFIDGGTIQFGDMPLLFLRKINLGVPLAEPVGAPERTENLDIAKSPEMPIADDFKKSRLLLIIMFYPYF